MPVRKGQHLEGIRTLEDVRMRCYCDSETGCWHWRQSMVDGSPRVCLYIPERGGTRDFRGLRAAVMLQRGEMTMPRHVRVWRNRDVCRSEDCVNPSHARVGTQLQMSRHLAKFKVYRASPLSVAIATERFRKIDAETAAKIRVDPRPAHVVAEEVGLSKGAIHSIRRGATWRVRQGGYSVWTALGVR